MRTIERLGLAVALASVAAAVVWPVAAMAEGSTALCRINEPACPPSKRAVGFHALAGTVTWKIGLTTVLCLSSLDEASVEGEPLANPLHLKTEILTWNQCGTTAAHNNCEVSNLALPLFDLLHEPVGAFEGRAIALGWELKINCSNILLVCVYGGEVGPFLFEEPGWAMVNGGYSVTNRVMEKISGGAGCTQGAEVSGEYEWAEKLWTKT